jgi:hypothetical protein
MVCLQAGTGKRRSCQKRREGITCYVLEGDGIFGGLGLQPHTAEFAVESIRRWWWEMGKPLYPKAQHLLITADCGGSNGYRVRLWRVQLQKLADGLAMAIEVCHFPPGTSKWNKIEHRMFCHITQNWRGRPLLSREVVVNLIGNTTTATGLRIRAELDEDSYEAGIKVSDDVRCQLSCPVGVNYLGR